jgi:transcriptional repressor NrdR
LECKFRFSTLEEIEILDLSVLKKNGVTESYSKDKLGEGLKLALRKRNYTEEQFKKILSDMERDIQIEAKNNSIESTSIGKIVMNRLKKFDTVAYVRFASVYRDFKDPQDFAKEVAQLNKKT